MNNGAGNLIAGLDIGSDKIRMTVGQMIADASNYLDLQIIGAVEYNSEGVYKGKINSIEDLVSSISGCLENTERMVGMPIDSVWVGVNSADISLKNNRGIVAVSKSNNEINEEDVSRALEASRTLATPLNYDILHVMPKSYLVDNQVGIKDPVGMTGMRLEVESNIILGPSAQAKHMTNAIYRTGLEIDDLVVSVLATAEAVLTKRQKELGVVLVNFGASTTSVAVYEEGELLHISVLPFGSENITNDLAIGLRTSVDIAEEVKKNFGNCIPSAATRTEQIDLKDAGMQESEVVKQRYINQIIEARMEEILQKIDLELKQAQRSGLLPAGVVFTGGGSKIPGLVNVAKKVLCLPACLGYSSNLTSISDQVSDLGFSTSVGLVKWGSMMEKNEKSGLNLSKGVNKIVGQVKKMFKTLVP